MTKQDPLPLHERARQALYAACDELVTAGQLGPTLDADQSEEWVADSWAHAATDAARLLLASGKGVWVTEKTLAEALAKLEALQGHTTPRRMAELVIALFRGEA